MSMTSEEFWMGEARKFESWFYQANYERTKLRELCKELLDLCYDAYEQKWGWDDDWALAYEQAKKLGVNDG